MATTGNAIASAVGTAVGTAVSGATAPLQGIFGLIDSIGIKALSFIPDPEKKLEFQQHTMDVQAKAATDQLAAITAQIQAQAGNGDKSLWKERAFFCVTMTLLYVWNYAICRFFHQVPIEFPAYLHLIFVTIMLGLTGAPTAFGALTDLLKSIPGIMALPGDSQVSVLGVKIGNKS